MDTGDIVFVTSRLVLSALAAFVAILVWLKTRELSWSLIVSGAIFGYVFAMFDLLTGLGVIDERSFSLMGIPVVRILIANFPTLLFACGFLVRLRSLQGK